MALHTRFKEHTICTMSNTQTLGMSIIIRTKLYLNFIKHLALFHIPRFNQISHWYISTWYPAVWDIKCQHLPCTYIYYIYLYLLYMYLYLLNYMYIVLHLAFSRSARHWIVLEHAVQFAIHTATLIHWLRDTNTLITWH